MRRVVARESPTAWAACDDVMTGRCLPNAPNTARPLASVAMNSLSRGADSRWLEVVFIAHHPHRHHSGAWSWRRTGIHFAGPCAQALSIDSPSALPDNGQYTNSRSIIEQP